MASMHDPPESVNDDVELRLEGPHEMVSMRLKHLLEMEGYLRLDDFTAIAAGRASATLRWPGLESQKRANR